MKNILFLFAFIFFISNTNAQSCEDLIKYVESESYGTTYNSPLSDAVSKVTFHTVTIDYQTYYFAIVCFKQQYSYGCSEYIYQVGSTTETYYSMNYLNSAGKAFWKYIQPHNKSLKCGPDSD